MTRKKVDLSDIKAKDLDETSSFSDIMSRSERLNRKNSNEIDDMIKEKRKNTEELSKELKKAQQEYKEEVKKDSKKTKKQVEEEKEEVLGKTQIMELTRVMKFNFEENKERNKEKKKHGISPLNIVGELNLLCIGYYIYLLAFTNYQDIESRYMLNGGIIVLMVLLFGLSVVTNKKLSKFFYIINILIIVTFLIFNTYTLIN